MPAIAYTLRPSAGIAQLVEQRTENPRVGSSTLPPGTIFWAEIAQLVERITRNDEVRGSIPRFGSTLFYLRRATHVARLLLFAHPKERILSISPDARIPNSEFLY